MFEDTKTVIQSEVVNRRRTDNTMTKRKRTNNDLQSITLKTKNRATRNPLKLGVNSCVPEGLAVHAPHVALVVLLLLQSR